MDLLQKSFDKAIQELAESAGSEEELEKLANALPERITEALALLPQEILASIKKTAEDGLAERRAIHTGFVERNCVRWKEGFDLLELLVEVAVEAGECFNKRARPEAVLKSDITFDIVVRLHAKGCLICKEILVLLMNGYADGAHARWRALHEISVTAMFLEKHGADATQRYLDHEFVEAYKGASQLNEYESRINEAGFSQAELAEFKKHYNTVIDIYGKEFNKPYGWAQPFLPKGNQTFFSLEKAVGLDHWRPYYKLASQNIHANVKTIRHSLGLSESSEDILQVGPSNSGMIDPAHSTAISISQLTCTLVCMSPNLDDLVAVKMLLSLSDETGEALVRCNTSTSI